MKFRVVRPFRDLDGIVKTPGCTLEIEFVRASKLRRLGLIGQIAPECAVKVPKKKAVRKGGKKAVKPPGETRNDRPPKEQEIVSPGPAEESVENGAETGNSTGD